MKTVLASEFKAECIALLKKRPEDKEPIVGDAAGRADRHRVEPIVTPKEARAAGTLKGLDGN